MKKVLIFAALFGLCACAQEAPAPVQEEAEETIQVEEIMPEEPAAPAPAVPVEVACKDIYTKLQNCEPSFCKQALAQTVSVLININGIVDGKCDYVEGLEFTGNGRISARTTKECAFDESQLPVAAEYIAKLFNPDGTVAVKVPVTLSGMDADIEKTDGQKFTNITAAYFNNGTCSAPAAMPADTATGDGRM